MKKDACNAALEFKTGLCFETASVSLCEGHVTLVELLWLVLL